MLEIHVWDNDIMFNIHHQTVDKFKMMDILLGQKTVMEPEPYAVGIFLQKKQVRVIKILKRRNLKHPQNFYIVLPRLLVRTHQVVIFRRILWRFPVNWNDVGIFSLVRLVGEIYACWYWTRFPDDARLAVAYQPELPSLFINDIERTFNPH